MGDAVMGLGSADVRGLCWKESCKGKVLRVEVRSDSVTI